MRILALGPDQGWHADQLRAAAARRGHSIEYAPYERLHACVGGDAPWRVMARCGGGEDDPLPQRVLEADVVLARTMPFGTLEQITYRLAVLHAVDRCRAPVVNPPRTLEIAIDKFATLALAQECGWRVPATEVCQTRGEAMEAFERLGGHVVVKPLLGSEGRGVLKIDDPQLAWTTFTTLERLGTVLYVQRFIAPGGRDLRLLIWGDRIEAVRRENPEDWRTNVSRGARSQLATPPTELRDLARRFAERLDLVYGAIDIAEDEQGVPYFLEINAVPGWKGAQGVFGGNLAEDLVRALEKTAKNPAVYLRKGDVSDPRGGGRSQTSSSAFRMDGSG